MQISTQTRNSWKELLSEREGKSTDHTIQNNEHKSKEKVDQFNVEENLATDAFRLQNLHYDAKMLIMLFKTMNMRPKKR